MTITISFWAIPIILNILLLIWAFWSLVNDSTWWAGLFQVVTAVVGTLFIWLVYFATMYFVKC